MSLQETFCGQELGKKKKEKEVAPEQPLHLCAPPPPMCPQQQGPLSGSQQPCPRPKPGACRGTRAAQKEAADGACADATEEDVLPCERHTSRQQLRHVLSLVPVLQAELLAMPVSPFFTPKEGFLGSILVPGPTQPLANRATSSKLGKKVFLPQDP